MNELMKVITDLGLHLVPLAFLLYLPIRWVTYFAGGFPYNRLLNGLWYAGVVVCYLLDVTGIGSTVTLLMFISMMDGFFIHLEKQRDQDEETVAEQLSDGPETEDQNDVPPGAQGT
jgi:hypothetical protein